MGTAGYMSPEQVRGEPADQRSDIFALGSVLYEMAAGRRAFARDTAAETMTAILREEPPEVLGSNAMLPPEVDQAIRRCLEKSPQARFQSASDLAYNLRSLSSASAASPARTAGTSIAWRRPALWFAAAVVISAALVWLDLAGWRDERPPPGGSTSSGSIDSLAVLPFVNVGGDEDTDYLSDGIPASIIDRLSRLSALRVVPRHTAFHFRGPDHDLTEVGRSLEVSAILMGEVRAQDDTLVIRVELVDVHNDRQLWGERFVGTLDDILVTEEQIAGTVSEALRIELNSEDRAHLVWRGTSNPEAHRYYLRGRHLFDRREADALRSAVASYTLAIEEDPEFALAYCGLSNCWIVLADGYHEPRANALARAREAMEQALALGDDLAEIHASLALLAEYEWNPGFSDSEHRRALEMNPKSADARYWYGWFLACQGRFDAGIAEMRSALQLDPVSGRKYRALIQFLLRTGEYEEALDQTHHAMELDPDDKWLKIFKGRIQISQGRYGEGIATIETAERPEPLWMGYLGWAYGRSGRYDEARTVLSELDNLAKRKIVSPDTFALVHVGLAEFDQAFELLESALSERSPGLAYLKLYPEWDPIREDPRFPEFMSRVSYFSQD
jgi:serine/threonine-protein kinase